MAETVDSVNITFDELNHVYTLNGERIPGVTEILSVCGVSLDFDAPFVRSAAEFKADLGTKIHLACNLDDQNDLNEEALDDQIRPYLAAWRRFRANTKFNPVASEEMVYSAQHRYAGRVDCRGSMFCEPRHTLVDIKTGQPQRYHLLQLWAYSQCFTTMDLSRRVVYLQDDGNYKTLAPTAQTTLEDRSDWLACLSMMRTLRRYKKWPKRK